MNESGNENDARLLVSAEELKLKTPATITICGASGYVTYSICLQAFFHRCVIFQDRENNAFGAADKR